MQKTIPFLAFLWLSCGSAAVAEETWVVVPACGPRAPARDDVIAHSELWQCVKAEFAKSESAYLTAREAFLSRVPEEERIKFHEKMKRWEYDDAKTCTKRYGMDFGCAIIENVARARLLDEAAAQCEAGACHVTALP
jgi:hypothetical protein